MPAPISTANIAAFTASTVHRKLLKAWLAFSGRQSSQQLALMTPPYRGRTDVHYYPSHSARFVQHSASLDGSERQRRLQIDLGQLEVAPRVDRGGVGRDAGAGIGQHLEQVDAHRRIDIDRRAVAQLDLAGHRRAQRQDAVLVEAGD